MNVQSVFSSNDSSIFSSALTHGSAKNLDELRALTFDTDNELTDTVV